jgi:hypothetical protein
MGVFLTGDRGVNVLARVRVRGEDHGCVHNPNLVAVHVMEIQHRWRIVVHSIVQVANMDVLHMEWR